MAVSLPPADSPVWNNSALCNYTICPVQEFGQLEYRPSLAGNAFFLAFFSLGLLIQVVLAILHGTYGFLIAMIGGCGLEIIGYTARIELYNDDFDNNYFIIYLVGCSKKHHFIATK